MNAFDPGGRNVDEATQAPQPHDFFGERRRRGRLRTVQRGRRWLDLGRRRGNLRQLLRAGQDRKTG